MSNGTDDLEELSKEIRKIISDNKKFIERVMDDEFEPEEPESSEEEYFEEL